ncbi:MAG: hypothetical protein GY865_12185 [candidate division Zixibacteria bacterium]|nr:hypothetical protein [candidate division Zixibacteria bacterium]
MQKGIMWIARVLSSLVLLLIGFILVVHIIEDDAPSGMVTIISMGSIFIGLIAAWKWELIGSLITIGGYIFFAINIPMIILSPYTICFISAVLFLISWYLRRKSPEKSL